MEKEEVKKEVVTIKQMIDALSNPGEYEPQRVALSADDSATALCEIHHSVAVPFFTTGTYPNNADLKENEMMGVVTRQAERAAIFWDPNGNGYHTVYDVYTISSTSDGVVDADSPPPPVTDFYIPYDGHSRVLIPITYLLPSLPDCDNGYTPHGPLWLPGADGNCSDARYIWGSRGWTFVGGIYANSLWAGVVTNVRVGFIQIGKAGAVATTTGTWISVPSGSGLLTFEITLSTSQGYVALFFEPETPGETAAGAIHFDNIKVQNFSTSAPTGVPVWCHQALPDLLNNLNVCKGLRINAASVTCSNTVNTQALSGRCVMMQPPAGTWWTDHYIGKYDSLADSNQKLKKELTNAKKGSYCYLKPMGIDDFKMTNHIQTWNGYIIDSSYPISPHGAYTCPPHAVTFWEVDQASSRSARWKFDYGVEYITEDSWRSLKGPSAPRELCELAITQLRSLDQFRENPTHTRDLKRDTAQLLQSVFRAVQTYGPGIMKFATMGSAFF